MRNRGTVLVMLVSLTAAQAVAGSAAAAPGAPPPTGAAAKAKKCKKGLVRRKGRCVCAKGKVRRGARCVTVKKKIAPAPTPGAPTPGAPTTPGATDGPPFAPPGKDLTGTPAANAILPFLANSTFTDCPLGIGAGCAVEERYGHFGDGTMYYCRLTPTAGSDIINSAHPFQIIGADQKADGSWAVTLKVDSYGQLVYYTWSVTAQGVANGLYWGPGKDPQSEAPAQIPPLQWIRGARNCSY